MTSTREDKVAVGKRVMHAAQLVIAQEDRWGKQRSIDWGLYLDLAP